MRSYGNHPRHTPSPGPRQPSRHDDTDPGVLAERDRVLAIVADLGRQAAAGRLDHLSRRELLRILWVRIRTE